MPKFTLQQIVDQMRMHPRSSPVRNAYIQTRKAHEPDMLIDFIKFSGRRVTQACAIGEAALQLGWLAEECVSGIEYDEDDELIEALESCVPETQVDKDFTGNTVGALYGTYIVNDAGYTMQSFWRRAEYWFSFAPETARTRIDAIKKAAKEFNIPLT